MQSHCLAFPRFQAEVWPSVTVVLRTRAPGQACVGFPPLGRVGVHVASFLQVICRMVCSLLLLCNAIFVQIRCSCTTGQ